MNVWSCSFMRAKVNKKSNTAKKNKENIETYNISPELCAVFCVFTEKRNPQIADSVSSRDTVIKL